MLTNLDSGSGAAIIQNAKDQGVAVIDYDRLTLDGDADYYYVSFDNEAVGRLQGETLVECVEEQVDDQSVPDWDNQEALVIFEQMLTAADNDIDAVLAANDGLGNAAIKALKSAGMEGIPVSGQDATVEGVQNIVAGDQCMTVYKAITREAEATAELAVALRDGEGIHPFDEGQVLFEGEPVDIHGPADAAALGIEVVYQDLALADNLDAVQNMYLGRELGASASSTRRPWSVRPVTRCPASR